MKKHAALLTRKLGPLPFWAWAVVGGGVVYWYRNRQAAAASSTDGVLGYTGPIPGAQGPPGPTGPPGSATPTPGSPGGRKHQPPKKKKRKKPPKGPKKPPRSGRGRHVDHGHGHHKAVGGHHTGAQHTHHAKKKRIIGKGRGRHVTHTGVHHDLHGNTQVRNEPHHRNDHPAVTMTKHSARNARPRVQTIRAALTSVSPIPRGAGRPRVGSTLTAEGRNRGGGLGLQPRGTAGVPSRNRIAMPPEQGHVTRQAHPSRAARPIVLRGGRNPEHAESGRSQLHATQKKPGQLAGHKAGRQVRKRKA